MRRLIAIISMLCTSGTLWGACTATKHNADYSEVASSSTVTLATGSSGGITKTSAVNAVGDFVAISAWCYQNCTFPGTMAMGSMTATRTSIVSPGTTVGVDGLHTGQTAIYYISSASASGNQALSLTVTGSPAQTQLSYIDFGLSAGCAVVHSSANDVEGGFAGTGSGSATATLPTISSVTGDLLFSITATSQHTEPPAGSPWSCPTYSNAGETGTCAFNTTVNGAAYILSAGSGTIANNWTIINNSTSYEALISGFSMSAITTHYVSSSAGSNTNNGTSEATPWASLPNMASCTSNCSSYSVQPGDTFVLKGCDVWTATDLPIYWNTGGSSGSPITIGGEDKTWYNTTNCPSAWNRPVFSNAAHAALANTNCGNDGSSHQAQIFACVGYASTSNYVTFDNIEWTGLTCTGSCTGNQRYLWFTGCANCTASNNYFHGLNIATDNAGACDLLSPYESPANVGDVLENNIFDGSDRTNPSGGGQCDAMYGDWSGTTIDGNVIHDMTNGILPYGDSSHPVIVSRNLIYNILLSNGSNHDNAIELVGGGTFYIHDNVVHDALGEQLMFGNTSEISYVWNNLWYNILGNPPEAPQTSGQTGISSTWWNNTIVASGTECIQQSGQTGGSFTALKFYNTHCITTNGTAIGTGTWQGFTPTISHTVLMTPTTATSQGFTSSETFAYSPTLNTNSTVGAGTAICGSVLSCSGNLASAIDDTTYACTYNASAPESVTCPARTVVARGAPPNTGAYEFSGGTSYTLSVPVTGSGSVSSSPSGIAGCTAVGGTCSASFSPGTVVTLTAVPGIGQEVNAWADGCSGTGTTCLVTMNANETATIVFSGNALTTSQLANNLTATSTNFSISNGIVTSAATNSFGHYAWLGISRCTTATQLNGQLLFTNASTTTSSIVGNLYNTQLSVLSPANVSTTADTTCYFQGQGWNAFVIAPFPGYGSLSCPPGNGPPSCSLASPTVGPGSNTWAFDAAVPCGSLNGRPCVPIVQMADPSYTSTHAPLVPSLAGETFEQAISLNDGLGDYMFLLTVEGAQEAFSGHIDATHCGGFPCFINDVTSAANAWNATSTLKAFSRNPANNPGPHKALVYGVNTTNPYAPVVESWTLQYASGAVTAISGPNVLFNVDTCPAFGYTTVGTGLATMLTPRVDNFDNIFYFALGSGAQGGPGRHMVFAVALNSGSTPATRTCKSWDTEGTTGSGVSSYQVTTGHGGTTYTNGATVTGVCGDTYTITASGGVVSALAQTAAGSSCYFGAANAMTGGGGTGLEYDITGVGTAGATNLLYAPIAGGSCPAGTTLTCEAPIATTIYAYGIHGGAMLGDGVYAYTSGWGQTADPTRCSACDAVEWSLGSSSTLTGTTSGNQNGHESIGFTWIGTASNPTYYQNNIPAGIADPTCSSSSDCYLQFTLASSCSSNPGGSQMHSGVSSLGNQDISATWITSSINTPGTPVQTNPLGTACGLGQNSLFQVDRVIGGATHWLAHHYENGNNYTSGSPPLENFEGADTICAFAPDDAFALCGADQNTNFTGNTGLGADNNGAAFVGTFSYTPPSNLIVIPYPAPLIGLF